MRRPESTVVLFAFVSMLLASGATAQPRGDVKILLPLVVEDPIPGAFGSLWTTRISLLNTASRDILVDGYASYPCTVEGCTFRLTPPSITFTPQLYETSTEVEGYFLYSTAEDEPFVDVKIHAQDLSRQALTWGTEIPAVAEPEAFTSMLSLVSIPIGDRFRSRLRIYDFDPSFTASRSVGYKVYAMREGLQYPFAPVDPAPADQLLASGELTFAVARLGYPGRPGFAQVDLDQIPQVAGQSRIRVELSPLTTGLRYWAFVSVTNNETQHITTVTPR